MRKKILVLLTVLLCINETSIAQQAIPSKLKVFIDCHSGCDMTYMRSEINIVDFVLDRIAADLHVLITDQNTGSGGDKYQLIFFGQNQFKNNGDTIYFDNDANNTDFEERQLLIKYLKLGLTPYITKTKMAQYISIGMKIDNAGSEVKKDTTAQTKDPWNYWVYNTRLSGSINSDAVYKNSNYYGSVSASRVTEDLKIVFELEGGKERTSYETEDSSGVKQKIINKNNNYEFSHYLVKSINTHWSYAYHASLSRSTFSNNKQRSHFRAGIEYNIFPYKQVNTKFFTIAYIADIRRNSYFDTTLYEKTKETLSGHAIETNLSFNQKWGTIGFGLDYHNYFHNWKYFNLEANMELEIRITGGLSFSIYTSAELIRDQIYLPKEKASTEEILTRRRQIASGYSLNAHFGVSYRFGSKLNNFVNPRFR
jgi:hypothetical protein